MLGRIVTLMQNEISGERAINLVTRIAAHHRIQSSPGFRAAAELCEQVVRGYGLETETFRYVADGKTSLWGCLIPQEWEAVSATLELIEPEKQRLADFSECKISLIQRSAPASLDSVEIVVMNDGLEKSEYAGADVRGKLVLTKGDVDRVHQLAVEQFGAAGIVFDGMREVKPVRSRLDVPDARQYTSFWWQPGDKKCFGFVLSPRQGDRLRALAASGAGAGRPLRARARVDSYFRDGSMEVLSCFIPGESLEEVTLISHLCHPEPSANDNASGCAAVLETMRAIKALLDRREIPPLKRGIRALLLPEMTGSFAYLATHDERFRDMVCAFNVDMAGENQTLCGSTFMIESPPDVSRGFTRELAAVILDRVFQGRTSSGGTGEILQERIAVRPFNGGSDHIIFTDPDVNVPCPSLGQWPDKFYHTSMDTPDKTDPAMLAAASKLAGTYAVFSATAGVTEARWLGLEVFAALKRDVTQEVSLRLTGALDKAGTDGAASARAELARLRKKLSYMLERSKAGFEHLARLGLPEAEVMQLKEDANEWVRREFSAAEANFLGLLGSPETEPSATAGSATAGTRAPGDRPSEAVTAAGGATGTPEPAAGVPAAGTQTGAEAAAGTDAAGTDAAGLTATPERRARLERLASLVPHRVLKGPSGHGMVTETYWSQMDRPERESLWRMFRRHERTPRTFHTLPWYWVNGKRTLAEIADLVEMETDLRNDEFLEEYFEFLEKAGLVKIEKLGP